MNDFSGLFTALVEDGFTPAEALTVVNEYLDSREDSEEEWVLGIDYDDNPIGNYRRDV